MKKPQTDKERSAMYGARAKKWTPEEISLMVKLYPTVGPDGMTMLKRTRAAIIERAHQLGIKCPQIQYSQHLREVREQERIKRAERMKLERPPKLHEVVPDEYIAATDIFQVGYRVAKGMGVLGAFQKRAA